MAGEMTQAEETAVMNGSTDSGEGAASEETAQEWNDEEFVSAFDGTEEIGGEEELEKESETEKEEAAVKPEGERTAEKATLEIGGREYTASDVEGLLSRITELQAAVNTVSPEREFVERLAAQAGMDVEAFLQDGGRMLAERQIQARTAQLVDQGLEESMARHVAEDVYKRQAMECPCNEATLYRRRNEFYLRFEQELGKKSRKK